MKEITEALDRAESHRAAGEYVAAERAYSWSLRQRPGNADLLLKLGTLHLDWGNFETAIDYLLQAAPLKQDSAEVSLALGSAYHRLEDFPSAAEWLRRAVERNGGGAEPYNLLGRSLRRMGRHRDAADSFRRAHELAPDDLAIRLDVAESLESAGEIAQARTMIHACLEQHPNSPEVYTALARMRIAAGDHAAGLEALRNAAALDGNGVYRLNPLGHYLGSMGRHEEAIACFDEFLAAAPNDLDGLYGRGICYIQLGEPEKAAQDLKRAATLYPNSEKINFALGAANAARGKVEAAAWRFRRAARCKLKMAEAHYQLARTLDSLSRHEEATPEYAYAAAIEPKNPEYLNEYGLALMRIRRRAEAIRAFRAALDASPHYFAARLNLSRAMRCEIEESHVDT